MDEYQKAENAGRKKFKDAFGEYYTIDFTDKQYDRVDFYMTANTPSKQTYVGEIKNYEDRPYAKYVDYAIDYDKVKNITSIAAAEDRIPVLAVFFSDVDVVWNLNDVDFESTKEWMNVNKDGQHYGKERENSLMTHLKIDDARWTRKK